MNSYISIMVVTFCLSLYTPFWINLLCSKKIEKLVGKAKHKDWYVTGRQIFNVILNIISIFVPSFCLMITPYIIKKMNALYKGNLSPLVIIIVLGGSVMLIYVAIYIIIKTIQKYLTDRKLVQIFIIDKNVYKMVNGLYAFLIALALVFSDEIDAETILILKYAALSFSGSNFFYLICETYLRKYTKSEIKYLN